MNKFKKSIIVLALPFVLSLGLSCNKFLDIVPNDGIATLETAFNLRSNAIKYLATCYSYMPNDGTPGGDPAVLGGDEIWDLVGRIVTNTSSRVPSTLFNIARGYQSATLCYGSDWASMYQGIRCCDILVDNVDLVPDMTNSEKLRWKSEAKFLKAYYHFNLVRKFGPVPIIRKSLDMDASIEEVRVYRDPIDDCYDFILALLDEALSGLPTVIDAEDEYGRITQPICAALKAKVAVYAASPLFNSNQDMASLVDNRGVALFPNKTEEEVKQRWVYAMEACKEAIDLAHSLNYELYSREQFDADHTYSMDDIMSRDLTLRCSFYERWNPEIIWANTNTSTSHITMYQSLAQPNFTEYKFALSCYQIFGVPLKIAEQFYTRNGLPINNDLEWAGANPYELRTADDNQAHYLEPGYTTVRLNFYREPRFYSSLGFDGGTWIGCMPAGKYIDTKPEDLPVVKCRIGGKHAKTGKETGPVTGYYPKKIIPHYCIGTADNRFSAYSYAFPVIRLTDLYLLYAEAINEAEGPNGAHKDDLFSMLNQIRSRAGIPDVVTSWDEYSNAPGYYNSQVGMRDIIHRERLNELAFESQRFWDLRRWKEAPKYYQENIYGFNVVGSSAEDYYIRTLLHEQSFGIKDYFFPIAVGNIEVNPNLTQNLGW